MTVVHRHGSVTGECATLARQELAIDLMHFEQASPVITPPAGVRRIAAAWVVLNDSNLKVMTALSEHTVER